MRDGLSRGFSRRSRRPFLGLATGETPLALYKEVTGLHREEGLDFSNVTTFNLDEYLGLGPEHPASYHFFMHEHLFRHINVPSSRIHIPDGLAKNVPAFCVGYEKAILDAGGIDLQVLGIGTDGPSALMNPVPHWLRGLASRR
ncbi:MAG TPA: 6-phosphogluconolactonase [Terrimicrobiaceae bacterium]